jgi:hypothetical protein
MRALIAFAAAAAAFAAHAESLEVYRSVDAQGRVTYTNVKPKGDDFDVLNVEYESQPKAATTMPALVAPPARTMTMRPMAGSEPPAESAPPIAATLRVVSFPSLRLAGATGEPSLARRRKAVALPAVTLRIDPELRSLAVGD